MAKGKKGSKGSKKSAGNKEREAYKQKALRMSRYRLRKALEDVGVSAKEIRAAASEGEDKMVEMLMMKYDGGEQATMSKAKEPPKRQAKRKEPDPEPEDDGVDPDNDDGEDDPFDEYDVFGDDDDDSEGNDDSEGDDESGEDDPGEDDEDQQEDDGEEEVERHAATGDDMPDLEALEEKLDKVMDLVVTTAANQEEIIETLTLMRREQNLLAEIVKLALARIWKLGAAKPLKPGFGEVVKKAEELVVKKLKGKKKS